LLLRGDKKKLEQIHSTYSAKPVCTCPVKKVKWT
jgi:hypothetical protein